MTYELGRQSRASRT